MSVRLNAYLGFRGNAREAIEFYHSVFGGNLSVNTFGESGATEDPSEADKVMHGMLETPGGLTLMAADAPGSDDADVSRDDNISMSLSGFAPDEAELRGYWEKLSGTGTVVVPLEKAPWGDHFGMCDDQFGIHWMVNISGADG